MIRSDSLVQKPVRIHGMDALRAMAMLSVVLCHASIPYGVKLMPPWPVDNIIHTVWYSYLYVFIRAFCMTVFFCMAGFFARLSYIKSGSKSFILQRYKRIFLPLLVGLFTIVPLSIAPFIYYKFWMLHPGQDFFEIIRHIVPYLFRWNGFVHLWFMYYLLLFYITMLILIKITGRKKIFSKWFDYVFRRWFSLSKLRSKLFLIIPLTLILCLSKELPIEIYTGATPHILAYLYFGFFFCLGYILHRNYSGALHLFIKGSTIFLILGIIMTPFAWHFYSFLGESHLSSLKFILIHLIAAVQIILLLFGFIGFFIKYANSENNAVRYFSDASYWIYLVHVPVVAGMEVWLIGSFVPGILRFWIVSLLGILIPLATYALFVRYTWIGKALNGSRKRKSKGKNIPHPQSSPQIARTSH